ncbi:MAG: hypothetical protein HY901_19055 [Deltaproteobacteria bacterium]|nr:hypothetical protein [Deltaproteobacteria bacterium]
MAGVAVGFWPRKDETRRTWKADKRFVAKMKDDERARHLAKWRRTGEQHAGRAALLDEDVLYLPEHADLPAAGREELRGALDDARRRAHGSRLWPP